ncbi:unnamed protein product, partial [marine sediment metagenome]
YRLVGGLWYINLAFMYSGDPTATVNGKKAFPKWNEQLQTQRGLYEVVSVRTRDATGAATSVSNSKIKQWVPKTIGAKGALSEAETDIITFANYPESDFSDLDNNLIITGIA